MQKLKINKIKTEPKPEMRRQDIIFALARHVHPSRYHNVITASTPLLKNLLDYYEKRVELIPIDGAREIVKDTVWAIYKTHISTCRICIGVDIAKQTA